jgi:hypothetical protein
MRVQLEVRVRGSERTLHWADGVLRGDDEVLRRLQTLIDGGRVDLDDLVSVLRGVELVTAQQVSLVNLDLADPEGPVVEPVHSSTPPGSLQADGAPTA